MVISPSRNDPCPCGSGKKFKHCHLGQKPISIATTVKWETPQVVTGATVEPDGRVTFHTPAGAKPAAAWYSIERERAKGSKVLQKIAIDPASPMFGDLETLGQFDFIFAIDTNSRRDPTKVSVAHVIQLRISASTVERCTLGCFQFHGVDEHQENLGWLLLQHHVLKSADYRSGARYAVITDSDLGKHAAYNARELPIYGNEFLAPGFTLHYASDEGRGIGNLLIRECDREAKMTLKEIAGGRFAEIGDECRAVAEPFSHLRVIFNTAIDPADGWFKLFTPTTH
jgi:hypothetical protein